jgi:hypothetical protein
LNRITTTIPSLLPLRSWHPFPPSPTSPTPTHSLLVFPLLPSLLSPLFLPHWRITRMLSMTNLSRRSLIGLLRHLLTLPRLPLLLLLLLLPLPLQLIRPFFLLVLPPHTKLFFYQSQQCTASNLLLHHFIILFLLSRPLFPLPLLLFHLLFKLLPLHHLLLLPPHHHQLRRSRCRIKMCLLLVLLLRQVAAEKAKGIEKEKTKKTVHKKP